MLHPADVLYAAAGERFPALAACEHYAGSETLIKKAFTLQNDMALSVSGIAPFDITADCEDGARVGQEAEHATMIGELVMSEANRHKRVGVRIHDITHSAWRHELDILIKIAGNRLAYLVLPKPSSVHDVEMQIAALNSACTQHDVHQKIPVHVLIETPTALHEVWDIARLPQVESLDFGLMDFVSAHHGAIPAAAMRSPEQFNHALVRRAKENIAAAALANHIVPTHNVTTEFRDLSIVANDAHRARNELGYLRMWSIHPAQIAPIIAAFAPTQNETETAAQILAQAQDQNWGPIQIAGRLHDRASYRYYWELLQRAHAAGMTLAADTRRRFFTRH